MSDLRKKIQRVLLLILAIVLLITAKSVDPYAQAWMTASNPSVVIQLPTLPPETPAPRMEKTRNKVDLNTVDAWVLTAIPGVGETIAQRVIAYRQAHGSFVDVRELMRVDGIGEKLYGVMLEYVEVP